MRKVLGLFLLSTTLSSSALVLASAPAGACSCRPYEGRTTTAPAIFVGRFLFGDRDGNAPASGVLPFEDVQIQVDRVHVGQVHRTQHAIGSTSDPCGDIYDAQERIFFVFTPEDEVDGGVQPDGVYAVNACSSIPVADLSPAAVAELEALGPPTDPHPGASAKAIEPPSRVRPTPSERRWVLATVLGAAALGTTFVLLRRRHAAR